MTKSVFLTLSMGMLLAQAAMATPPVSISLSYDLDKGLLHVEAVHPSFDLNKSYVRLVNIYLNGDQVSQQDYYRQNDYNAFSDDIPVTAHVGDKIKVEVFCTLGGMLSQEMTVKGKEPAGGLAPGAQDGSLGPAVSNTAS